MASSPFTSGTLGEVLIFIPMPIGNRDVSEFSFTPGALVSSQGKGVPVFRFPMFSKLVSIHEILEAFPTLIPVVTHHILHKILEDHTLIRMWGVLGGPDGVLVGQ